MIPWKESAFIHAKEQDPKESCGLLLNIKGKEIYHPCRNLAITDHQCFIIDPEDYVKADDRGEIIAIIHSHPITPPTPSQADKVSCEHSNLPWHIVNPRTEKWGYCEPTGYKPRLLGRQWVWAVTDCWTLVRDWYKEEKNIQLRDYKRPTTPEEFYKNPLLEILLPERGFKLLEPNELLMNGDVLAMDMGFGKLNHVAIFLNGEVLHHLTDRLSCREPYSAWLQKCTGAKYRYVD